MTEYKENVWHGWNGGDCPVHRQSEVEAIWQNPDRTFIPLAVNGRAGSLRWARGGCGSIVAFRVVKEYREPREYWMLPTAESTMDDSEASRGIYEQAGYIRVREVLK